MFQEVTSEDAAASPGCRTRAVSVGSVAFFRRRDPDPPRAVQPPAPAPAPSVQPTPTLHNPTAEAFVAEIAAGDFAAASQRYQALPTHDLRTFVADRAVHLSFLEGSPADVPERVKEWTEVRPDDGVGWIIRGGFGVSAAWAARGGARAQYVDADAWPTFFELLNRAEEDLWRATELNPTDPAPWVPLLRTARGLQVPKEELRLRFEQMTRRDPNCFLGHQQFLQGIADKWSGSHEEMFEFARTVSASSPDGSPLHSLVVDAHLERWIDGRPKVQDYFWDAPAREFLAAAERSVLSQAFVDDDLHPSGAMARNVFAVGFGVSNQLRAAADQCRLIGDRPDSWPWVYLGKTPAERFVLFSESGPD